MNPIYCGHQHGQGLTFCILLSDHDGPHYSWIRAGFTSWSDQ